YASAALYPSSAGDESSATGASAGVHVDYHFAAPLRPWVGVGAGWHGYRGSHGDVTSTWQGADLARLQAGIDVPVTPSFSLDPFLGVTLATFSPRQVAATDAGSASLSVFVLVGALARFDLFGHADELPAAGNGIASQP
ncbi:MAG TPA: hypothetical protein VLW85_26380, partial [Myxococcales bacterium]|nr:hypothetical protein [Myxococcales bacterium]